MTLRKSLKSKLTTIFACGILSIVSLTGCEGSFFDSEVDALSRVQPVGSAFTRQLAMEYETIATREQNDMFDPGDGRHFAKKGLDAARGNMVMPEPIDNWDLTPAHMRELGTARGRLIMAFDMGAREIAPVESAIAQTRFDCWIEQQEENWQTVDILTCKSEFLQAMNILELSIAPPPSTPPVPAAPVENTFNMAHSDVVMRPADSMYIIFFGFNKNRIGGPGEQILDAVASNMRRNPGKTAVVVGFADRSGGEDYNKNLGQKRADAVRQALMKRGVSSRTIKAISRGESYPLVKTNDNVKEPANRRVEIRLQ